MAMHFSYDTFEFPAEPMYGGERHGDRFPEISLLHRKDRYFFPIFAYSGTVQCNSEHGEVTSHRRRSQPTQEGLNLILRHMATFHGRSWLRTGLCFFAVAVGMVSFHEIMSIRSPPADSVCVSTSAQPAESSSGRLVAQTPMSTHPILTATETVTLTPTGTSTSTVTVTSTVTAPPLPSAIAEAVRQRGQSEGRQPSPTYLAPLSCDVVSSPSSVTPCREGMAWPMTMKLESSGHDDTTPLTQTLVVSPAKGGDTGRVMRPVDNYGAMADLSPFQAMPDVTLGDNVVEINAGGLPGNERPSSWSELRRTILVHAGVSSADAMVFVDVMSSLSESDVSALPRRIALQNDASNQTSSTPSPPPIPCTRKTPLSAAWRASPCHVKTFNADDWSHASFGSTTTGAVLGPRVSWLGRENLWQAAAMPSDGVTSSSGKSSPHLLAQSFYDFPIPSGLEGGADRNGLNGIRPWRLVAAIRVSKQANNTSDVVRSWLHATTNAAGSSAPSSLAPLRVSMTLVALANITMGWTSRNSGRDGRRLLQQHVSDVWPLDDRRGGSCSLPAGMTVCLPQMHLTPDGVQPVTTVDVPSPPQTSTSAPVKGVRMMMATPLDQALLREQLKIFRLLRVDEGPICQIATNGRSFTPRTFGGLGNGDGMWTLCWPLPSADPASIAKRGRPIGFSFGNDDDFSFEDEVAKTSKDSVAMNTLDPSVGWAQAEEAEAAKLGPGMVRYRRRGQSSVAFPLGIAAVSDDNRKGVAMRTGQPQVWRVRSLADIFRLSDAVETRFSGPTVSRNVSLDPLVIHSPLTQPTTTPAAAQAAPQGVSRCTALIKMDVEGFEWEIFGDMSSVANPEGRTSSSLHRLFHSHRETASSSRQDQGPSRAGQQLVEQLDEHGCSEQVMMEIHLWQRNVPAHMLWSNATTASNDGDEDAKAFEGAVQSHLATYPEAPSDAALAQRQTAGFPWNRAITTDAVGQLRAHRVFSHILDWLRRSFYLVYVHENPMGNIVRLPLTMRCCYELTYIRRPLAYGQK